jgi:hypothetical protein
MNARREVLKAYGKVTEPERRPPPINESFMAEASGSMEEDEEAFNVEAAVAKKTYLWSDKYRPRKPRYFNRVHTGFEWNKYNQTHYDADNPPPKVYLTRNCTP